jgi:ABC-2 type transport system permease protein
VIARARQERRAASPVRATAALASTELRLALRRGETLLATAILPVVVLAFFSSVAIAAVPDPAVGFLLPGSIAFAIIATSLVSLGITTAYDRHYGVLKRLGGTPLTRAELLAAKAAVIVIVELAQVALLVGVAALILGWQWPAGASVVALVVVCLVGTFAFAGIGLLLAGTVRAEAVLALANGLFVASLVLGGIIVPVDRLPDGLAALAPWLPFAALSDGLRVAMGAGGDLGRPLLVLTAWAAAATGLVARTFRWE